MKDLLLNASMEVLYYIQNGMYDKLRGIKCLDRVSEEYISMVINEYGGILDASDKEIYEKNFQYIQLKNQRKYMTYLDLMIDGERSDLTLMCEIELVGNKIISIIVDDIHVL